MEQLTSEYVKFDRDGKEQMKLEYKADDNDNVFSTALTFVTLIIQRPPLADWKSLALFVILRICFFLYGMFFLVFGLFEVMYRFTDYFWLLHITMLTKLVVLRIALGCIKKRLEGQSTLEFLKKLDESRPYGKSYFRITTIWNIVSMGLYYGVWSDQMINVWFDIVAGAVFILGTLAYTLFSTCVLMMSITDAKMSYSRKFIECGAFCQFMVHYSYYLT